MSFTVRVTGADKVRAQLSPAAIGQRLRPALLKSGLVVQEDAQKAVHSPDHPYIGKAGKNVATGRLQAAIGTSDVRGNGLGLSVRVGTPYGKTGTGTFARSSRTTRSGRTGDRRNKSDPNVYGPIEERRHAFLVPSLERNIGRIRQIIANALFGRP